MLKIEHIGIAVKEFSTAIPLFEKLLNTPCYKTEMVASEQVNTAFFQKTDSKIELLESTDPNGIIARYIDKKGEGIHHIAFEVADIVTEMARLQAEGFVLLNEKPKKGADNKWVCFLHPKDTHGVLVELCQEIQAGL
jgi:methylmalonyl-CoA/ethylmalonyl-CoA epimerase